MNRDIRDELAMSGRLVRLGFADSQKGLLAEEDFDSLLDLALDLESRFVAFEQALETISKLRHRRPVKGLWQTQCPACIAIAALALPRPGYGDGPQTVDSNPLNHQKSPVPPDRKGSQ